MKEVKGHDIFSKFYLSEFIYDTKALHQNLGVFLSRLNFETKYLEKFAILAEIFVLESCYKYMYIKCWLLH